MRKVHYCKQAVWQCAIFSHLGGEIVTALPSTIAMQNEEA